MSNDKINEEIMKLAKKRVILKKSLLIHLMIYIIINALLLAIYFLTTPGGYFWPIWSISGWGVGLIIHGIVVMYLLSNTSGAQDSTTKEYEQLMQQQKKD